jgi:hypothetical protein
VQLLLLKRGGQVIYSGKLGRNSQKMIEYFEVRLILHYDVYVSVADPIWIMTTKVYHLICCSILPGNSWSAKNQRQVQPGNVDA